MSYAKKAEFLEAILAALDDVSEAKQELNQMRSEYTGYSPSYALASWIEAEDKAKKRLMAALDKYVDYIVSERLASAGTWEKK